MSGPIRAPQPPSGRPVPTVRRTTAPAEHPMVRLQRAAGNAAVARSVQRDDTTSTGTPTPKPPPPVPATAPPRRNYVFLMGDTTRDPFYVAANVYFAQHEPGATVHRDKKTLAEVISTVNAGSTPALKIIIVSHANEEGNLGFSLDAADLAKDAKAGDHKPRVEYKELRDATAAGSLPVADVAKIDASTRVEIKGCNIGRSALMLNALDKAFGGAAQVTAPTHKQEYSFHGNKKAGVVSEEALFQYSIEDPGHPTVAPADRATRFTTKYPDVPATAWPGLLAGAAEHHVKRENFVWRGPNPPADDAAAVFARIGTDKLFPGTKGWVVSYKGRTEANGRWTYEVQADIVTGTASRTEKRSIVTAIPPDPDALKAQQIADSGRPDAYVWTVEDTVQGDQLVRKVMSERTEWVIDKKVIDKAGTANPPVTDATFYGRSTYTPPPPPPPTKP